ncbi:MAG: metabolite traffic protein EboE [Verrucomicrobiota bacterium]
MILQESPRVHLSYCLNIHPGETLEENLGAIEEHALRVKQRVSPDHPFGLGLRFGHKAVEEIEDATAIRSRFDDWGVYAFTVNGFPYGAFHQTRVKENVYLPDWQTEERTLYTKQLTDVMAQLVPSGTAGSISTLPLTFKDWPKTDEDMRRITRNLIDCVIHMNRIEEEEGIEIHLGLEPEPCCGLETTTEFIDYFNNYVLAHGLDHLEAQSGFNRNRCEDIVRRHLGINLDTCHLAIQYEDLAESIGRLTGEGIRLSKVHISAALAALNEPEHLEALAAFDEPVYLHQVKGRTEAGEIHSWTDLPAALRDLPNQPDVRDLRIHFHVPLFWEGSDLLGSTSADLTDAFFGQLKQGVCEHLEIETYTFDVLPDDLRADDIVDSISGELEWALQRLR